MKNWDPDGFMISNGPGDPSAMPYAVKTIQEIVDADEKMFGICLGSQIFSTSTRYEDF